MGRLKLQSGIKAIEEEPSDAESINNRGALACMINSEVGAVLAVMRRNVRWAGRYMAGDDQLEHLLIQNLKTLRKQIFSWKHQGNTINPNVYLQPFLDVIQSDETGAPITGVALSSVYKILALDILDLDTVNVAGAMHSVVDAVTSCRFEVTDPTSEEVVLMKILQVLLSCMKSKVSVVLHNQHVCTIVNTCFRIVHQAGTKGELLQRMARHTMHELVRCIFSHVPDIDNLDCSLENGSMPPVKPLIGVHSNDTSLDRSLENGKDSSAYDAPPVTLESVSNSSVTNLGDDTTFSNRDSPNDLLASEPYGIPCMVEIFHYLCSLLNYVEQIEMGPKSNPLAYDEDVPLFALGLINSAIELGGPSIKQHPKLLSLIQDELFRNLMQFGLSMSPLILSMVCSIVLNLYHHLRTELKMQLEAFFACVVLRLAQSRYGSSYQQQEVIMEALVDFCRQKYFMAEMYANLDCDITCSNVFEDLANLLSKSAFPVNCPLSAIHVLALDSLIAVIQGMAERIGNGAPGQERVPVALEESSPFFKVQCENYSDPCHWINFVRRRKYIKRRLAVGADNFNRDPKKGLEFLQGSHLLPAQLDPQSVACFFRYTSGLDKTLVGDFLGNHDEFCIQVLQESANTIDFQDMNLDTALRFFPSRWIDFLRKSKRTAPFLLSDDGAHLDQVMFPTMSGPTLAAFSVVFDHAEQEDVFNTCVEGFLAKAKNSAGHHLGDILDDRVISLCRFTTLLNPSSVDEPVLAFGDDVKARMATETSFTIANRYGDYIRTGWRNILDCILRLHKLGLLRACVASDVADDLDMSSQCLPSPPRLPLSPR